MALTVGAVEAVKLSHPSCWF